MFQNPGWDFPKSWVEFSKTLDGPKPWVEFSKTLGGVLSASPTSEELKSIYWPGFCRESNGRQSSLVFTHRTVKPINLINQVKKSQLKKSVILTFINIRVLLTLIIIRVLFTVINIWVLLTLIIIRVLFTVINIWVLLTLIIIRALLTLIISRL